MKKQLMFTCLVLVFMAFCAQSFAMVGTSTSVATNKIENASWIQKITTTVKSVATSALSFAKNAISGDDKSLIGALICFLLGGLGIHRVYLGSKPIIILWYILTLGGFVGLIPLIDLIRLIMGQADHYQGNNSLFACFN